MAGDRHPPQGRRERALPAQQAEFAADLWQVHLGEGTDEYRDPVEFFRRTYLTESLKGLLVGAIRRLAGRGGDPVVQLQTNFGGGKTHSMLALYHLFSGTAPGELAGIDTVLQEAQATELGTARRVVLVGNKISPGNPVTKADGTVVRTLWGELAWQLGGRKAFARIAADDEKATNPGDALRELFNEYGPCLILIDEWVAYARQLHDQSDLPTGSFETQFSFAQALTESAKLANHCLLVISLPANIAIDDSRVQFELTRYLTDNWVPVLEKDVDGPSSLPLRLDGEVPNLGKFAASRRVARAIYLGSAPTADAAHRGIEDRRVKLGCVMPGESPAVFGDALRRLAGAATYLYQDGPRYWYSTQPTVTKLAEDRAEQLKRDPDKVVQELGARLRSDLRNNGEFNRVHPLPQSSQDVPDDRDARLVVLAIDTPYSKERGNSAETAAKAILETRGSVPRIYRNTLVFLAVDKTRLQDLDEAVRRYLAWESILGEREPLDLSPYQVKQAEIQKEAASSAVTARLPEAYQWLLVPGQSRPDAPIEWLAMRLSGQDSLAARASKKLKGDELLVTGFAATRLRMELDRVPLWRGDHVSIKQIVEDFARYLYLPRASDPQVLLKSMSGGVALLTWEHDAFAFADSFDDEAKRYRGLRGGQLVSLPDADAPGLLVKPDVARRQLDAERREPAGAGAGATPGGESPPPGDGPRPGPETPPPDTPSTTQPVRFHGTVPLDSARVGRDGGRIADEVISHLSGLVGATVTVTLEIQAEVPSGAPDHVVRTVTENSRTLKFTNQGFEKE